MSKICDFKYAIEVLSERLAITKVRLTIPCSPEMKNILQNKVEELEKAIEELKEAANKEKFRASF